MPQGSLVTASASSGETPQALHGELVTRAVPALAAARYRLQHQDASSLRFERRYVPGWAWTLFAVLLLLAVGSTAANGWSGASSGLVILFWISVAVLIFYRKREGLSISIQGEGQGSRLTVAGHVSKRGQDALKTTIPALDEASR